MFTSDEPRHVRHYVEDGLSAVDNIEASLAAAGRSFSDVTSCLDFPSGYGRVIRHLVNRIPPSRISASDIDYEGARFCQAEFGVRTLRSHLDPQRIPFERYDLIFVGSLLTHLPASMGFQVLDALRKTLYDGGLLIFTTQGESCLGHLDWYGPRFAAAEAQYVAGLKQFGSWHLPYGEGSYGVTLHSVPYLREMMSHTHGDALRCIRFSERGWDKHQDVWTYQQSADAGRRAGTAEYDG